MMRVAWLVARKDLRIETRSRVLLWQVLPFGVIALILSGLAVGPNDEAMRHAAPGLFYLVILLVVLFMIGRGQAVESPAGTRTSVAMLGADPAGIFLGKTLALFVELVVTAAVLLTGVVVLLHAPVAGTASALPSVLLTLGALAAGGTLYGALVAGADVQATLLPIIALPPFAGLLIIGEKSFAAAVAGQSSVKWLLFLFVSLLAYLAVGILLYGVTEES